MANEFLRHYLTLWNSSVEWVAEKIVDELKTGNLGFDRAIELKAIAVDFSFKELEKDIESYIIENYWSDYAKYKDKSKSVYTGITDENYPLGI